MTTGCWVGCMLAVVTPRAPTGVKLLATSKTLGIRPGKGKEKSDEHNECEGKIPKLRMSKKHGVKLGRSQGRSEHPVELVTVEKVRERRGRKKIK